MLRYRGEANKKTMMKTEIFASAYRRLRERLLPGAARMLSDTADGEDALQDVFCRLWASRDSLASQEDVERMGARSLRNECIDTLRRRTRRDAEDATPADCATQDCDELFAEVDRLMRKILSARDREILIHRERDEWEYDELAAYYSLSPANLRMIVSRARRTVRDEWLNLKNQKS